MRQEIVDLYDQYTHERLDRRVFMDRLAKMAGGTAAAAALVPLLEANYAAAAIVPEGDARLTIEEVTFPGAGGEMRGYMARPADASGQLPGVVVIHENRGLNPHIENALAAVDYLAGNGKVGVVGFCWGGGLVNQVAVSAPEPLGAAVAFYGRQAAIEDVPNIKAVLMLHYAGLDKRINASIPAYEEALKVQGVDHTIYMYDNVNHAFHNDTSEARYDQTAAELAWNRTIAFFKENLG